MSLIDHHATYDGSNNGADHGSFPLDPTAIYDGGKDVADNGSFQMDPMVRCRKQQQL